MPHVWITGRYSRERLGAAKTVGLPGLLPPVDAHRRLRGPYTAAGTVLRALIPGILTDQPDLVYRHDIEVLSAAPELREHLPASRETLTSLAVPEERTRYYSRFRTRRIAHGLTELLRDYLATGPPRMLVVDNAHNADPTDAELLAIMLRRVDPAVLTLVVCAGPELAAEHAELTVALDRYASRIDCAESDARQCPPASDQDEELAAAYVNSDCTGDEPALVAAYERLGEKVRARLHDARADQLAARAELTLHLGAIPFHRERGSDPAGAGTGSLNAAIHYCIAMGFYHATADLGRRGRALVSPADQEQLWWTFTTRVTISLAALSRTTEAEKLYDEGRACTTNPEIHAGAAYATAMLYTRHHEPEQRDHQRALAWINEAIVIGSLLPDPRRRAFESAFGMNGRALVELHLGDLPAALRLVEEGLALLDRELGPDEHRLHRSVLLHNRAQVLAGLGRLDDALAGYSAVIDADPNYAEYYMDRGNLLREMGRDEAALADYATAIRLSPPFPEVHYNRADLLLALGDVESGLAGLDYVLELDPEYLDAYVNRAGVLAGLGEFAAARPDVDAGLALDPDNPHLLCVLGQLHAQANAHAEAQDAFDRALGGDPGLQAAWAGRAALAYRADEHLAAIADLDRALDLGDDPALRYNRAVAYQALGRFAEALADLDAAAALDPADTDILRDRKRCRHELGLVGS